MSQIDTFEVETFASAASDSTIEYTPQRLRDGVAYMVGSDGSASSNFDTNGQLTATASVRSGRSADLINNVKRVKRKFVLKGRLPVTTPGMTAGGVVGDVVDYIDVEFTIAAPVEATQDQLLSAMSFGDRNNGPLGSAWVEDMLISGLEPY